MTSGNNFLIDIVSGLGVGCGLPIEFTQRFYGQLAAGKSYQEAFAVAKDEMKLLQGAEVEGLYLLAGA